MAVQKHIIGLLSLFCLLIFLVEINAQKKVENLQPINDALYAEDANSILVDDEFYNQLVAIFECNIDQYKGELLSTDNGNYGWKWEYYMFMKPLNGFQLKLEMRQQNSNEPEWSLTAYKQSSEDNEQYFDALCERLKNYGTIEVQAPSYYLFKGIKLSPFKDSDYYISVSLNKYSQYVSSPAEDHSITIYVAQKPKIVIDNNNDTNHQTKSKKYVTCSQCNGKGHLGVIKNTEQKRYEYEKNALGEYKFKGSTTTGVNQVCPKCSGKGKVYE